MKDILLHLLEITKYQGDKDQVISSYTSLVSATAINMLIGQKEKNMQEEIIYALESKKGSVDDIISTLSEYFDLISIDQAFKKASERCFTSLLKDLIENLSPEDEKKVTEYLSTLSSPQR